MGQLIHGKWVDNDDPQPTTPNRHALGTEEFPFDKNTPAGRYHLYISRSCPFALRTDLVRNAKQLNERIGLSSVNPENTEEGWSFEPGHYEGIGDNVCGKKYSHEVYTCLDPHYTGRVTVPLLIDTQTQKIVSNESADIVKNLNEITSAGPDLAANADAQQKAASFFGEFLSATFSTGKTVDQKSYDEAISRLIAVIEKIETHLASSGGPFSAGKDVTAVDVLTFPILFSYESGSNVSLAVQGPRLREYPHLDRYIRALYQSPGIADGLDIKQSHRAIFAKPSKFYAPKKEPIVPPTPKLDWDEPI